MNQADFQANTPYARFGDVAINASADERRVFIKRTYIHLMLAIYAFVAFEWLFFAMGLEQPALQFLGTSRFAWLIVLGGFMGISYLANSWATSSTSRGMQYAGLSLYVIAEALIFVPLLAIARQQTVQVQGTSIGVIPAAAITTLVIFGGLTAFVFISKQDFSFLGAFLGLAGFSAIALIVVAMLFGLNVGIWFVWAMVVLASGYILYDTSNVLHRYRTDQYVAASLALFASVALLFWYVLQLFMRRD
ncbi:MAG TPA: Bax inhibitor-1 family protein [Lacipirellulaceae bacterium]|nr:Bax inhibitor-1 family protein [Lacipirellulaceae bacterium]